MAANIVPIFSADRRLAQIALHLLRKSLKILFAHARDPPTTARHDHPGREPEWPDRMGSSADRDLRGGVRKLFPAAACWQCKMWSKRGNREQSLQSRSIRRQSPCVRAQ